MRRRRIVIGGKKMRAGGVELQVDGFAGLENPILVKGGDVGEGAAHVDTDEISCLGHSVGPRTHGAELDHIARRAAG